MAERQYRGSCQCGAVTYEAEVDLDRAVTCNCSRCQRLGFTLALTPAARFTLLSGEDNLSEYRFASKTIRHLFCKTCGIESFALGKGQDGAEVAAINANCLDGVDPRGLNAHHYDGASV